MLVFQRRERGSSGHGSASALILLGAVVCAGGAMEPADAGAYWISVDLRSVNQESELRQVDFDGDGRTEPSNIGGKECRRALPSGTGARYIYFGVADWYYAGPGPGVTVVVEYYSASSTDFYLDYDSTDSSWPVDGAYKASSRRNTGSAGSWRKAVFWLPDPRFEGRQNAGADFRIAIPENGANFYVAFVALARPPGPYVAGSHDDFAGVSYGDAERFVYSYYFYWHSTYSREHLVDGDRTDALTDHPAPVAGVTSCEYLRGGGPTVPSDYSYRSRSWHRREMQEFAKAEIDVVLPVYWGGSNTMSWSIPGLEQLVGAMDEMRADGHDPPRIGMFYDTSTLQHTDDVFNYRNTKSDLLSEDGRNFFCKKIVDFFSVVPPRYWARVDDKPLVVLYAAAFAAAHDTRVATVLDQRFAEVFGGLTPYVVRERSWNLPTESRYAWGAAVNGPQLYEVATVGPGFDNSAVPGGTLFRDRENGSFYINGWNTILDSYTGNIVGVETWNELHEATEVADSVEYGSRYRDLTKQYAARFKGYEGGQDNARVVDNTIPPVQVAGQTVPVTLTVENTGSSTWSEPALFRLGAVDDSDALHETGRVELPPGTTVAPGETFVFEFAMTAPLTPGSYLTDWQMVREHVRWFGEVHGETVQVVDQPPCVRELQQLVHNPRFGGTRGLSLGATGMAPFDWRAFSVGGGSASVERVPLAPDELFAGSPPVNAVRLTVHQFGADQGFDNDNGRFEIRRGFEYHTHFYIRTGNSDNSNQRFQFSFPLFDCTYLGISPGGMRGIATSVWQKMEAPVFSSQEATHGHIAWRVQADGGSGDSILIALPSVVAALPTDADQDGDGVADHCDNCTLTWNPGQRDLQDNGIGDACESAPFRRGDPNDDGVVDISDAIYLLLFLFSGRERPTCMEAADVNDGGMVDVSDAVFLLRFLFLDGATPPFPGALLTSCGQDPDTSPHLGCLSYRSCAP